MQYSLFDQYSFSHTDSSDHFSPGELFEAYGLCRKNKRNTLNALAFELDYEHNLLKLCQELNNGSYQPGRSIAFIVSKPVKREIFAADFRDRVVHHLIINKLNPFFEEVFIHDSYSCRVKKGTHYGINRINTFIGECSNNYAHDCYVLKLDIQGFFMHINRRLLSDRLRTFISNSYFAKDKRLVADICDKIIFNDPTKNCIIKGNKTNWDDLPAHKSLFNSPEGCGLPIGNLTSQVFANFYMNPFDWYIKQNLGVKYYGRYVDDFVIVHQSKEYLKSILPKISTFLDSELNLTLHPKKVYLQHYNRGVKFLGTFIKPNRIYIANRTKGFFYEAIQKHNDIAKDHKPSKTELLAFQCCMNSYLGILKHYKTYRLRKRMIFKHTSAWWWNYAYVSGCISKLVLKRRVKKYRHI